MARATVIGASTTAKETSHAPKADARRVRGREEEAAAELRARFSRGKVGGPQEGRLYKRETAYRTHASMWLCKRMGAREGERSILKWRKCACLHERGGSWGKGSDWVEGVVYISSEIETVF